MKLTALLAQENMEWKGLVTREDPDARWPRGTGVWSCVGGRAPKGGRHPINHGWMEIHVKSVQKMQHAKMMDLNVMKDSKRHTTRQSVKKKNVMIPTNHGVMGISVWHVLHMQHAKMITSHVQMVSKRIATKPNV